MDALNISNLNITNSTLSEPARWPGAIMIVFSISCIFAYVLCIVTILGKKETAKSPSYQIILHIGIADIVQLALNGILGGIYSLCQNDFNFILNKVAGGIMNSGWISYTMMADLLAWNRCMQTYRPATAKRVFSMR